MNAAASSRWSGIALALAVVAYGAAPLFAPWLQVLLTIVLCKALAVLGIVVLLRAGQVSFGHAMYFAASAYAVAFVGRWMGGGELLSLLLVSVLASALLGLLVGLFVVRYRYIFFGMLNLAFSMVLYALLEKFFHVTGGSDGMRVNRPSVLGVDLERDQFETLVFYLALVLAVVVAALVHRYLRSPPGEALAAVKTNETRLEYLGVSPRRVLLFGYVVSAVVAGLGGGLLAITQGLVTPEYGFWIRSGEFVFIAVLGGAGHVAGAFAGSLVYELVRQYAAAFAADVWQMLLGIILLAIILFASQGLVGMWGSLRRRLGGGRA